MTDRKQFLRRVGLLAVTALMVVVLGLGSGLRVQAAAEAAEAAAEAAEAPAEDAGKTADAAEAPAEDAGTAADAAEAVAEPVLLVTVNGEEITDQNPNYLSLLDYYRNQAASYGIPATDEEFQTYMKSEGMNWAVQCVLYLQKAKELNISVSDEERAAYEASAKAQWESAVSQIQAQMAPVSAEASEEEKASARASALAYIQSAYGYTEESYTKLVLDDLIQGQIFREVRSAVGGEIGVTDEEIQAEFDQLVEESKETFKQTCGEDVAMFEMAQSYLGKPNYYVPEGYRGITHILLKVDDTLLNHYLDLKSRYEEQQAAEETEAEENAENGEVVESETAATEENTETASDETAAETEDSAEPAAETAEAPAAVENAAAAAEVPAAVENTAETAEAPAAEENAAAAAEAPAAEENAAAAAEAPAAEENAAEPEVAEEPVTAEMVEEARQAILASIQPQVDEIMAKYNAGTAFGDLIAEYGTDPGMNREPYKSEGYSVHADSIQYDSTFTKGAMALEKIGEVGEPIVSSSGVHILYYLRDVPAGPVTLTDEIRAQLREELLTGKQREANDAMVAEWKKEADIQYSEAGQAILDALAAYDAAAEAEAEATEETPGADAETDAEAPAEEKPADETEAAAEEPSL